MSTNNSKPVLMLDWGIGGLSVYAETKKLLPNTSIVYFSDSGSLPYGKHAPAAMRGRLRRIILSAHKHWGIHRAVIACNAASTALADLQTEAWSKNIDIIGMIEPATRLVQKSARTKIGVIGGRRTIESKKLETRLGPLGKKILPRSAQPLSAFVERGELSGAELERVIGSIVDPIREMDALLLACTHYPALNPVFAKLLPGVELLDPAQEAARDLASLLGKDEAALSRDRFFTTGDRAVMEKAAFAGFGIRLRAEAAAWLK